MGRALRTHPEVRAMTLWNVDGRMGFNPPWNQIDKLHHGLSLLDRPRMPNLEFKQKNEEKNDANIWNE